MNTKKGHSHFFAPWSYLVCFKNYKSRANWYRTAPELAIELHRRLYGTKSGKPILRYGDASTLTGYQLPSKAQETIFCRREEKADECTLSNRKYSSAPSSFVQVRKSALNDYAGRGLIAAQNIPANTHLFTRENVNSFNVLPLTWYIITSMRELADAHRLHFVNMQLSSVETFTSGMSSICSLIWFALC